MKTEQRIKLTKRLVDGAKADGSGEWHLCDQELRGFCLRVYPSGLKSYVIRYRVKGRSRRCTLGPHGVLTAEQARDLARDMLARVRRGEDPSAQRQDAARAPTIAEL